MRSFEIFLGVALSVMLVSICVICFLRVYLLYSRWWHRLRKYKYRVIQSTVVSMYNAAPRTYFVIQKKGWFGWRDNPDIPGYCPSTGKFSIWRTSYYDTFDEVNKWMDMIDAIMVSDGEK